MRLAYFSPLSPQKSGIAVYSEVLIQNLSNLYDIDLWVNDKVDNAICNKYNVIRYDLKKPCFEKLEEYDVILYNLGNNPFYHSEMYGIFLKYPGIVILHDYVLYYLITGYYLNLTKNCNDYFKEFHYNYGDIGIHFAKQIFKTDSPIMYQHPENYPLVKRVIENAKGVIVHSNSTKELIQEQNFKNIKITKINQVNYSNMCFSHPQKYIQEVRKKFNVADKDFLVSSLGYIAPTKRNLQIINAINEVSSLTPHSIKYLMVGEGSYVDSMLNDNIIKTGYVAKKDFEALICSSDVIINLRYPSMGETSAALLQAMAAGKPCIVSNNAWFSELPDDVVLKITTDESKEKEELKTSLLLLIGDSFRSSELGKRAQDYVLRHHDPSKICMEIKEFIDSCYFSDLKSFRKMYSNVNLKVMKEIGMENFDDGFTNYYHQVNSKRMRDLGFYDQFVEQFKDNEPKRRDLTKAIAKYFRYLSR